MATEMNSGPTNDTRVPVPVRRLVVAVLLALGASAVQAQSESARALPSAAPPLNLSLSPQPLAPLASPMLAPATPAAPASAPVEAPAPLPPDPLHSASEEIRRVARWVADSGDNGLLPYLLIDKVNATAYAFNAGGQLQGSAPVLLGMARGDKLLAENSASMSVMPPEVRITPAGRFVSKLARDSLGKELLVLDYEASISLHPVVTDKPAERRIERLKSATVQDNRISFGCINVPVSFYEGIVSPIFTSTKGIVYVLPETAPASDLFAIAPAVAAVPATAPAPSGLGAPASEPVQVPAPAVTPVAH